MKKVIFFIVSFLFFVTSINAEEVNVIEYSLGNIKIEIPDNYFAEEGKSDDKNEQYSYLYFLSEKSEIEVNVTATPNYYYVEGLEPENYYSDINVERHIEDVITNLKLISGVTNVQVLESGLKKVGELDSIFVRFKYNDGIYYDSYYIYREDASYFLDILSYDLVKMNSEETVNIVNSVYFVTGNEMVFEDLDDSSAMDGVLFLFFVALIIVIIYLGVKKGHIIKQKVSNIFEPKKDIYTRSHNIVWAIVGSLIGGIIATIPWFVASNYTGFFVGWLGFIIGYGALYGYKLFGGRVTKNTKWIIIFVTLISIVLSELAGWAIILIEAGYEMSIKNLLVLFESQDALSGTLLNLGIAMFIAFFGVRNIIVKINEEYL